MNRIFTRVFAVLLTALMLSTVLLVGCGSKEEPLQLGVGVYSAFSGSGDADGETLGYDQVTETVAAVLLDGNGKIVSCVLDSIDLKAQFNEAGEYVTPGEFPTKHEIGDNYGMVAYGGAKLEWYKQADAFASVVIGKTADEVKALVVNKKQGNDEVIAAGCTIAVADFVDAIVKACNSAAPSNATAADALQLGVYTEWEGKNANEDVNGYLELTTNFAATTVNGGVVTAAAIDAISVKFGFDLSGASTTDVAAQLLTKGEQGDGYNMVAYGGAKLEWYKQAEAFAGACVGKSAAEISALVVDGYKGTEEVQTAGCTIAVNGFVQAAVKAAAAK